MGTLAIRARWALVHDGHRPGIAADRWIVVEGDRIAAIAASRPQDATTVIDRPDLLVLPGLINLHNHVFTELMIRNRSEDLSSEGYATNLVYGLLMPIGKLAMEILSPAEMEAVAQLGLMQIVKSGATTLMEPFRLGLTPAFIAAARRTGLRFYATPYLFSTVDLDLGADGKPVYRAGAAGSDDSASLREWQAQFDAHDGQEQGRIRVALGPHGTDSCGPDLLREIRRLADRHGCLINTHLDQSPGEAALIEKRYGRSPTRYFEWVGLLGPDAMVAHAVWATDADLDLLARTRTTLINCPRTYARGGVTASFQRFRQRGIHTVIGTDGYDLDLISELRVAGMISKLTSADCAVATAPELVNAVTSDAATALRRDDLGRIAVGARADLVAIDLGRPHLRPVSDPLKAMVWRASAADVFATVVDGAVLVNEGRFQRGDEAAIAAAGAAAIEKVWASGAAAGFLARSQ